ncbi:MAG: preprotein translocase subunit YajC [Candidatus Kapaibacterium sp.]
MGNTFLLAFASPPGAGGTQSAIPTFVMFGAIILIMYLMVIRPQQKRLKEQQNLISSAKRGDKVVLSGGIHGTIFEVEEGTILVEVAKNTQIRFNKASIQSIVKSEIESKS